VGLGVIGEVQGFSASEGGRFTWRAVSNYTTRDRAGGVLWDTGAHTLDMALFAACLDRHRTFTIQDIRVEKDKPEPSHDFRAEFVLFADGRDAIAGHLHVSRKEALPNLIAIVGSRGKLTFSVSMDDRVRLFTGAGSTVLRALRSYTNLIECFDLQVQRILLGDSPEPFAAENFLGQINLMEALVDA
jgi:predicted dehydrogenase